MLAQRLPINFLAGSQALICQDNVVQTLLRAKLTTDTIGKTGSLIKESTTHTILFPGHIARAVAAAQVGFIVIHAVKNRKNKINQRTLAPFIGSNNQICPRLEVEGDILQLAELSDFNAFNKHHARSPL